ncbi:GRAMD3 family protein [Megaselia abdita]
MSRKKKLKNKNNDRNKNCRSDDDDEAETSTVVLRKKSLSEVKSCNDLTEGSDELCAKNKSYLYLIKSHSFIDKASQEPDLSVIRSMLLESASARKDEEQVKKRPKSMPNSASAKRESFLRQSFHRLSRSFSRSKNKESSVGNSSNSSNASGNEVNLNEKLDKLKEEEDGCSPVDEGENSEEVECITIEVKAGAIRSSNSIATIPTTIDTENSVPVLYSQHEFPGQSVIELSTIGKSSSHLNSSSSNSLNYSTASNGSKSDIRSSKSSKTPPTTPPIGGKSSPSTRSISPHPKSSTSLVLVPSNNVPEKEKKRKEPSNSRQKKFHRHFDKLPKEERVLNYFSCALVSDILLQGHLYITQNNLAFYSNVFGFVTKLVIPTSAVIKISKEKTAKIIPNAVGVATSDERHVFGSFISREAAYRLLCSVCPTPLQCEQIIKPIPELEISEECSIEDDSSCSISGNESPPQLVDITSTTTTTSDASQNVLRHRPAVKEIKRTESSASASLATGVADVGDTPTNKQEEIFVIQDDPLDAKKLLAPYSSTPKRTPQHCKKTDASSHFENNFNGYHYKSSQIDPTKSLKSSLSFIAEFPTRLKFPTDFHIVYLGIFLTVVLAMFSGFLLYRVLDIEAKTSLYDSPIKFNYGTGSDADIFAEAIRWQRELQARSTEEAQSIINSNLKQIAKVNMEFFC